MYINTVQLASYHLHGDTCNKDNIDKIDITLLCFSYCENQHIHLKGMTEIQIPFRTPNTELPGLHNFYVFPSLGSQKLNSSV